MYRHLLSNCREKHAWCNSFLPFVLCLLPLRLDWKLQHKLARKRESELVKRSNYMRTNKSIWIPFFYVLFFYRKNKLTSCDFQFLLKHNSLHSKLFTNMFCKTQGKNTAASLLCSCSAVYIAKHTKEIVQEGMWHSSTSSQICKWLYFGVFFNTMKSHLHTN